MARDLSEITDDYCRDNYGHTNWGYLDTYTKEELADKSKYDIEYGKVFWYVETRKEVERCQNMYLVVYTSYIDMFSEATRDEYIVVESLEHAREIYEDLITKEKTTIASICIPIESTDYSNPGDQHDG